MIGRAVTIKVDYPEAIEANKEIAIGFSTQPPDAPLLDLKLERENSENASGISLPEHQIDQEGRIILFPNLAVDDTGVYRLCWNGDCWNGDCFHSFDLKIVPPAKHSELLRCCFV